MNAVWLIGTIVVRVCLWLALLPWLLLGVLLIALPRQRGGW